MNNVAVGFNGQMRASECAQAVPCGYQQIIRLLKSKKLKGQKKEGIWWVEASDFYRVKPSIKSRSRKHGVSITVPELTVQTIQLEIPIEQYRLLDMALANTEHKTLKGYLAKQTNSIYDKVKKSVVASLDATLGQ